MTIASEQTSRHGSQATQIASSEACIEALVDVLPRISRLLKAQIRGGKLSAQHVFLLMSIDDLSRRNEDGAQPGEMARRACLSSAAITSALDDLVADGYCGRTHSEKDRRKVLVHLTPSGRQVLLDVRANAQESLRGKFDDWSEDRRLRLCQVLDDLDGLATILLKSPPLGIEPLGANREPPGHIL